MKRWLIGFSFLLLVGGFVVAQQDTSDDTSDTQTDPTVNVQALEVFSGSILDYLESRSAQNPSGGTCYEQNAELVAPEAPTSTDTTSTDGDSSTGGTTDGGTTGNGTNNDSTTDTQTSDSASTTQNTEIADTNVTYTCLVQILNSTGLAETLGAQGTYTLFAPTDDAFRRYAENVPASEFEALLADTNQLTQILNFHVLPEERSLSSLYTSAGTGSSPVTVKTLQGSDLTLTFEDQPESDTTTATDSTATSTTDSNSVSTQTFVRIGKNAASTAFQEGDAYAVQETVDTDNGYVIGIDHILLPETDTMTQ